MLDFNSNNVSKWQGKTSEIFRCHGNLVKMWSAISHGRSNKLCKQQGDCEGKTRVRGPSQSAKAIYCVRKETDKVQLLLLCIFKCWFRFVWMFCIGLKLITLSFKHTLSLLFVTSFMLAAFSHETPDKHVKIKH